MKKIIIFFLIIIILSGLSGCAGGMGYTISSEFNKDAYKRTGLLVVRIGTDYPYSSPEKITLETDYSVRSFDEAKDLNIEDPHVIREAMPLYPVFDEFRVISYFKNITPMIYQTFYNILEEKDYNVISVTEFLRSEGKHFSELTVLKILDFMKSYVDSLVIVHYVDIGSINAEKVKLSGFNGLFYRITMFDARTGETVLSYATQRNHFNLLASYTADPDLSSKVSYSTDNFGEITRVSHDLSEKEQLEAVLKYMANGLETDADFNGYSGYWFGLNSIFP
jgi:hypothetical protein